MNEEIQKSGKKMAKKWQKVAMVKEVCSDISGPPTFQELRTFE